MFTINSTDSVFSRALIENTTIGKIPVSKETVKTSETSLEVSGTEQEKFIAEYENLKNNKIIETLKTEHNDTLKENTSITGNSLYTDYIDSLQSTNIDEYFNKNTDIEKVSVQPIYNETNNTIDSETIADKSNIASSINEGSFSRAFETLKQSDNLKYIFAVVLIGGYFLVKSSKV